MEIAVSFEFKGIDVKPILEKLQGLVNRTAGEAETLAKTSMTGAKHGRFYRIPGAKQSAKVTQVYQASAPGEAPAIRPGRLGGLLFNSGRMIPATGTSTTAFVLFGVRHARFLNEGTRKMAARPFLTDAFASVTPDFQANAERFLGRS